MERRRCVRSNVSMAAAYRPRGGVRFPTALTNLTRDGGCIESRFILPEGSDGWLQLPTLSDWHAHVVWRRGSRSGLAFARPFHAAVAAMLVGRANGVGTRVRHSGYGPGEIHVGRRRGSRREKILAGVAAPPCPVATREETPFRGRAGTDAGRRQSDRRCEDRHYRIGDTADLYVRGQSMRALVINISRSGLTVNAGVRPYIGETVAIELPGAEQIHGTVSWWQDGCFGIHLAPPPEDGIST